VALDIEHLFTYNGIRLVCRLKSTGGEQMAISERRRTILSFIQQYSGENGYPPTVREIADAAGISSTSVVNYHLNVLQEEGYIIRNREVARGLRVVDQAQEAPPSSTIDIPLLGVISAGMPIPVPDVSHGSPAQDAIQLTRDIVSDSERLYALRVKGQSMIDALVGDGDVVVLRHQQDAENGDMVAVWLKDEKETTLKRFYHEGDRVRLQPANLSMAPIYVPASDVEIQGKVVVVIRKSP
jgi:repressor LexA